MGNEHRRRKKNFKNKNLFLITKIKLNKSKRKLNRIDEFAKGKERSSNAVDASKWFCLHSKSIDLTNEI